MPRLLPTIALATLLTTSAAQAFSVNLPLLTYPPHPVTPTAEQSCVDLTTLDAPACSEIAE
ncbi:hypothetical protein [Yoonia sp. I 8.24]|uniref:hypothetical protein n=1 Tax=Yoonia sp. I 8.24 TaxID=1537229 RepID=UPI001EDEB542|nr:hypothetical protein [Yoonia sp. I 8.24]MCG3269432.1 hypothetical protein [Yoonia sp. I 8.24]